MTTTHRPNREFSRSALNHEMRLDSMWRTLNHKHFRGKLRDRKPALKASAPFLVPGALAHFSTWADGYSEITIDEALCSGAHPALNPGTPESARWKLIEDALLHEMVHCAVYHIGKWDKGDTHGGAFAALAGGINQDLNLRQPPDWENWPFNVRPPGHYGIPAQPNRPTHRTTAESTKPAVTSDTAALVAAIDAVTTQVRDLMAHQP